MRFASDDVRDHIVCRKNDYEPSYALYGASLRWKSPKIDFREIFGVDRFSTFATLSSKSDLVAARPEMTRRATSRRPELSTRLKDHVERRLGSAAKARKTRLSRDLAQSTLAGLGTESQCHLLR